MTPTYVNASPGERLNARSARAVFRVSIAREFSLWGFAVDWGVIVQQVTNSLPALGGIVFQIGDAVVGRDTATFDVRVGVAPGAATVFALVQGIDDLHGQVKVTRIEWFAGVPGTSEGGANRLDETRTDTQADVSATADAERANPIRAIGRTLETVVILGGIAAILFLVYKAKND